jgi:hypothetical protein
MYLENAGTLEHLSLAAQQLPKQYNQRNVQQ